MKKCVISILPCISMIIWSKVILAALSFLIFIFCSCQFEEEEPEPPCTPGQRITCGSFLSDCWYVYDDCSLYRSIHIGVVRVGADGRQDLEPILVGQQITIAIGIRIGIMIPTSVDSISVEFCNNIYKGSLPVPRSKHDDYAFSSNEIISFNLPDYIEAGPYNFVSKAWSNGVVLHQDIEEFYIYPNENIPSDLFSNDKVNILVYAPMNTPANSIIYIARAGTHWPLSEVDTIAMNKLDAFRSFISIDFTGDESFKFVRDYPKDLRSNGGYIDYTFCSWGVNSCNIYRLLPAPTQGSLYKFSLATWYGPTLLPPAATLCIN